MSQPNYQVLRAKLDQLAEKGAAHLKALASREAKEQAWQVMLSSAIVAPVLILMTVLIDKLFGAGINLSFAIMALLFVGVPVLCWIGAYIVNLQAHKVDRRIALTFYDHQLGVKDRLQIADEFTQKEHLSDFEKAAVADASGYVEQALAAKLPDVNLAGANLDHDRWKMAAIGLAVLFASSLLNQAELGFSGDSVIDASEQRIVSVDVRNNQSQDTPFSIEDVNTRELESQPVPQPSQRKKSGNPAGASESLEPSKASPGSPKAASTASDQESASKQNQSGSAGAGASSQSAGSKDKKKKEEAPAGKSKKKSPSTPKPSQEQKPSSAAGVASGKGNASSGNPASSDKAAASNSARQEDEISNDEEAEEEEDEEQEAKSSASPSPNKRKAPVDRRLSPSAESTQESDQVNGRGGPSGLKKTRGVAAMLLGVPMPDRLQGTPNPGRTKSIQEQSQPEEQVVASVTAANRGTSNGPIGQVARKDLMPEIKTVVREYFINLRTNGTEPSNSETKSQPTTQDSE